VVLVVQVVLVAEMQVLQAALETQDHIHQSKDMLVAAVEAHLITTAVEAVAQVLLVLHHLVQVTVALAALV
jgi:hypothetical protein